MPDAPHLLPDPVLAVMQFLRARPEITALTPTPSVVSMLPVNFSGAYVSVTLAGSTPIYPRIDDAALQIDAMISGQIVGTELENQCSLLARTVRAAMWSIRNDVVLAGVLVSCSEELGPQWMPDLTPALPVARFTARYRVLLHP